MVTTEGQPVGIVIASTEIKFLPYALLRPETPPMLSAPEPPLSEPAEPGGSAGDVRRVLPSVAAVLPSSSDLHEIPQNLL